MDGKTFLFRARGFSAHMTLQIQFIMTAFCLSANVHGSSCTV